MACISHLVQKAHPVQTGFFTKAASLCLVLLSLLFLPNTYSQQNAQPILLDYILAVVEEDTIMASEFNQRLRIIAKENQVKSPYPNQFQQQVLDQMIIERIQLQLADRMSIKVNDQNLNEGIINIAKRNQVDLKSMKNKVESTGTSWADFREQIRNEMIINQLRQRQLARRIRITDQAIQNFLQSETGQEMLAPMYQISHILLEDDKQVKQVHTLAKSNPKTFAELAKKYSTSGTASQGGDLGFRQLSKLPKPLADAVQGLKKGQVSKPIQIGNSYHIIKLTNTKRLDVTAEERQISHILIANNALRNDQQSKTLINDIYKQVQIKPDTFIDLAKTYSDDPGSGSEGGDLGWVKRGIMVPEFEQIAFKSKTNDISEPFKTQYGWHILVVKGIKQTNISETRRVEAARRYLHQQQFGDELEAWLFEIRQTAYVKVIHNPNS